MQNGESLGDAYCSAVTQKVYKWGSYFVDSQVLRRLVPDRTGRQKRYLNPNAFLLARDDESVRAARRNGDWQPVSRADLEGVLRAPERSGWCPTPLRLVLVGGSGVGKTTNMQWLERELTKRGLWTIPLDLKKIDAHGGVIPAAVNEVTACVGVHRRDEVESEITRRAANGRLIILVDGLDQVPASAETFSFLPEPGHWLDRCGFVLAGRPYAFADWNEDAERPAIDMRRWRFIEPVVFTEEQAEDFADWDKQKRYHLLKNRLAELALVPRVLEFARQLSPSDIENVHTLSGLFERVVEELLHNRLKSSASTSPPHADLARLRRLLSALAFVSWRRWPANRDDIVLLNLDDGDALKEVRDRMQVPSEEYRLEALYRDLRTLGDMTLIITSVSLEQGSFMTLEWSNRTIVEFLAAQWLARYAGEFDTLSGGADTKTLRVFYAEELDKVARDTNLFLAEFPSNKLTPSSWLASARAWYDPQEESDEPRRWSTEMLYRSWRTMHDIAQRPVDDWWNAPYEDVYRDRGAPGGPRGKAAPSQTAPDPATIEQAQSILDRFFGDFQRILDHGSNDQKSVARQMISDDAWRAVPAGSFEMGASADHQGFPPKLKPFWENVLDKVQTGHVFEEQRASPWLPSFRKAEAHENVAERAAEWLTKAEWFNGLQGIELRKHDIKWLTEVLGDIRQRAAPDRGAPDYKVAYKKIEQKWRRRDEQPHENPQAVAAFFLHHFPVLHAWFRLFSPAHERIVNDYLHEGTEPPGPDHPVIYVSWFDAWAFCQWATWRDPEIPGRRYKVRLPHEPEWEYAARWRLDEDGKPVQSKGVYWWGDQFYLNEGIPDDLTPRSEYAKMAHVDGRPGATRAPAAESNGLGLHDTLGNVWEWMANIYDVRSEQRMIDDDNAAGSAEDAQAINRVGYSRFVPGAADPSPPVNAQRTMRGGLWYYLDLLATCSSRYRLTSDDHCYKIGFRIVREESPVVRETAARSPGVRSMARVSRRERTDFADALIVTAVPEEWKAVLTVETGAAPGSSWTEPPGAGGPEIRVRDFTTKDGELRVAIVRPFGMGRDHALSAAAPLLAQFPKIRCLAMCGVCAGRRGEVALGDVIIADRAWPYDAGKHRVTVDEAGHRIEYFEGDMDLHRIRPVEWGQRAELFEIDASAPWIKDRPRSCEDQADWLLARLIRNEDPLPDRKAMCPDWAVVISQLWKTKRLHKGEQALIPTESGRRHIAERLQLDPEGLFELKPFKIRFGSIATGAAVVQDPMIFDHLARTAGMRKVIGLEMETSAILMHAYTHNIPYAIVMKGVMDYGDEFKGDQMKYFAAKASAECLIAFLRENLPAQHHGAGANLERIKSTR